MTDYYVWHAATGSGNGSSWANAATSLASVIGAMAANDVIYIAHDHVQTQSTALTMTAGSPETGPLRIYCVNRAGSVPPVSADLRTTAQISTTVASAIVLSGAISECYGIIFSAGSSTSAASLTIAGAGRTVRLVNCTLKLGNSSATSRIVIGSSAGALGILENCTMQFGSTSQRANTGSRAIWRNTNASSAIVGATVPNALFGFSGNGLWFVEGVDLSAIVSASSKYIASGNDAFAGQIILKDCKLGAWSNWTLNAPPSPGSVDFAMIRCDSGDTNYRTEKRNFYADQTVETTIVRSGGATDGTTPIAWKIVTVANNANAWNTFECLPISIWNETVGSSVTVTVQGIWGGGAVPTNANIWIEVEYLGTSGFPMASKATSGLADGLATATGIPAGSGTWGGSTTKFAMSATFTPQEKGPITIYVKAGLQASTFYVDPKPVIT